MPYTGDLDKDLKVILPGIMADGIAKDRAESERLVNHARAIYRHNPTWGECVAHDDARARDFLGAFMRHWKAGYDAGSMADLGG